MNLVSGFFAFGSAINFGLFAAYDHAVSAGSAVFCGLLAVLCKEDDR